MKRLLAVISIVAISSVSQAVVSWQVTLSTTNAIVAPSLSYSPTNAWATGSIDAGAYITNSVGRKYWTPNGGTATSGQEPTHTRGISTGTDSIDWLAFKGSRKNITIQLTEAGDVWFIEGGNIAVDGKCRLLTGKGMAWLFDENYSGEINALAGSTTKTVTVTER